MRQVQLAGEFGEAGEEVVVFKLDAEQFVELRGHQDQGGAAHVADEDGLGEEIGNRADLDPGSQQEQQAAEHGHRGGKDGSMGRVTRRQRYDGAGNQQRNRNIRPHDDLPRAAEERIHQERHESGVESVLRRQAHQAGISDDRRDHDHAHADPRQQVRQQPLAPVVAKHP
jgi:hypothetical protein